MTAVSMDVSTNTSNEPLPTPPALPPLPPPRAQPAADPQTDPYGLIGREVLRDFLVDQGRKTVTKTSIGKVVGWHRRKGYRVQFAEDGYEEDLAKTFTKQSAERYQAAERDPSAAMPSSVSPTQEEEVRCV